MAERKARKRRSSTSVEELKAKIYAKDDEMAERRKKRGPTGAAAEAQEAARKRRNAAKYEQEKAEREKKGSSGYGYSAYMMGGSSRSSGFNPRSVREELLVDYLLEEGFASDEKSAQAIASVMSEDWVQSIVEAVTGGSAPQMPASVVKFVDELPGKIQSALQGKPTSSVKPKPKKTK